MRTSGWTPSIVPSWADQTVYIVENDFGRAGRAIVETDALHADLEATIVDLLQGQFSNPIRVIAFNAAERGRKTSQRTLLMSCDADAICSFGTCRPPSRILLSVMRGTGSLR